MVAATYTSVGGVVQVSTGYPVLGYQLIEYPAAVDAGVLVEADLELPRDARIESAVFEVSADAEPRARVSSVAEVRASTPLTGSRAAATVDFGRLVTVGGLQPAGAVTAAVGVGSVLRWDGSGWRSHAAGTVFPEVATERLLVQSTTEGVDSAELAAVVAQMGVSMPAVPGGLELLVDGRTVWFERQGSSPVPSGPAPASGAAFVVDRTDAVREAFGRAVAATPTAGQVTVRVALRALTPGRLALTPRLHTLRVHTQSFPPSGLVRSVDFAEEGEVDVDVTPPASHSVHEVGLVVRGSYGPRRVQPATGPPVSEDARLVLAVGRSVLLGLPRTLVSRFGTFSGVRLRLCTGGTGAEGQVTGRLLTATGTDRPGEPVDGGDLLALSVSAAQMRWHTLELASPVTVPVPADGDVAAWLELQPGYGEVECAMTGSPPSDPEAPGAVVRRRLSGGATGALTTVPELGPLHAALRVVGLPDREHPLAAVRLRLAGAVDALDVTPGGDDLAVRLVPQAPLPVSGPVLLRVTSAAAGSLALDTVEVTYRQAEVTP